MNKVTVRKNAFGHDVENAAVFSTRYEFIAYCDVLNKGNPQDLFLRMLYKIKGIVYADVYKDDNLFDVCVKKGGAFSWEEVEPEIMRVLEFRHDFLEAKEASEQ